MNSLDASLRARSAATIVAVCTVLCGCYYYVPYRYVPYGEPPDTALRYPFTVPDAALSGTTSDATPSTNIYTATATPVFVEPAYYPVAYPYYGWPWWGPSFSLSFGYWGGCCYGGGHHGYWGHGGWGGHGYWGHGQGGGWTGHGYRWRGGGGWAGGGGGHYWGGSGRHGPVH